MKYTILQNRVCVYACLPSLRETQTQPPFPWSAIGQRVKQTHEHYQCIEALVIKKQMSIREPVKNVLADFAL